MIYGINPKFVTSIKHMHPAGGLDWKCPPSGPMRLCHPTRKGWCELTTQFPSCVPLLMALHLPRPFCGLGNTSRGGPADTLATRSSRLPPVSPYLNLAYVQTVAFLHGVQCAPTTSETLPTYIMYSTFLYSWTAINKCGNNICCPQHAIFKKYIKIHCNQDSTSVGILHICCKYFLGNLLIMAIWIMNVFLHILLLLGECYNGSKNVVTLQEWVANVISCFNTQEASEEQIWTFCIECSENTSAALCQTKAKNKNKIKVRRFYVPSLIAFLWMKNDQSGCFLI